MNDSPAVLRVAFDYDETLDADGAAEALAAVKARGGLVAVVSGQFADVIHDRLRQRGLVVDEVHGDFMKIDVLERFGAHILVGNSAADQLSAEVSRVPRTAAQPQGFAELARREAEAQNRPVDLARVVFVDVGTEASRSAFRIDGVGAFAEWLDNHMPIHAPQTPAPGGRGAASSAGAPKPAATVGDTAHRRAAPGAGGHTSTA